uniref:Uncharacterized protein n=1 Tax=Vicia faba TaxID=3906 RepID=R4IU48_VICFA|nr:hypothetical protein [Vicia faba]AGC78855.1 hypothetical protein [Vicia faba]
MCHFSLVGKIVLNADFLSKGAIHRSFSKGRACRRTILGHSNFQGGYAYAWLPSPTEHYLPWRGIKFNYLLSSVFTAVPLRYQEEGIPGKVPSTHSGLFHS